MPKRRFLALVALLVAFTLALAACSSDDDDDDGEEDAGGGDVEFVQAGKLTVCSDLPYAPMEFEEDGEFTGFDLDLMSEIAEANDVELEVKVTVFDGILASLAAGNCDVVASSLTITEERAEQVLFSEPYFDADQSLLIRAGDEGQFRELADLAGRSIGVQSGTTGEDYATENTPEGATIRSFEGAAELFAALTSGEIDAVLQDFPINAYRGVQDDTLIVTEKFPTGEQYGFAVVKGNTALKDTIDSALAQMQGDGTYDDLFEKYFGTV